MISVSNVSMRYGAKILFDDVTITFTPGRRYGLTGPNGAGKSTFTRLITASSIVTVDGSNPCGSSSSPRSNRSASSFSVVGDLFFIYSPVTSTRRSHRNDANILVAVSVNSRPEFSVCVHADPRISRFAAAIDFQHHGSDRP